jgi:hypothetical protein
MKDTDKAASSPPCQILQSKVLEENLAFEEGGIPTLAYLYGLPAQPLRDVTLQATVVAAAILLDSYDSISGMIMKTQMNILSIGKRWQRKRLQRRLSWWKLGMIQNFLNVTISESEKKQRGKRTRCLSFKRGLSFLHEERSIDIMVSWSSISKLSMVSISTLLSVTIFMICRQDQPELADLVNYPLEFATGIAKEKIDHMLRRYQYSCKTVCISKNQMYISGVWRSWLGKWLYFGVRDKAQRQSSWLRYRTRHEPWICGLRVANQTGVHETEVSIDPSSVRASWHNI